ncbi:MAG: glycoside hydrolase family 9 protein, partial [Paludibacteraceae bacterium]|nr:glycoside hydrolase family 9 protein [Paludibacteraceae bacterium]
GKKVMKADKYTEAAQYCLDYILGCNSTGYCFVTGFGSLSPHFIHDRRCATDGIENPIPGYMVGGPNVKQTTDCGRSMYPTSRFAARAYLDEECSYSTNEPAINWNAPLVFLTAFIRGEYK